MPHAHDILRRRLHDKAGLSDPQPPKYDFSELEKTEWSPQFERLMRNRLLMGALRYGVLEEKRKRTKEWDLMGAVEKKIKLYHETGNAEYLVDIANYCLLEFECGKRPDKHFTALDNHHDHCKLKRKTA